MRESFATPEESGYQHPKDGEPIKQVRVPKTPEQIRREWDEAIQRVEEKLRQKYGRAELPNSLDNQLVAVRHAFGPLENIKGKRILDLGCGAIPEVGREVNLDSYEPWFCRTLLELGASPVGVDIGSLDQEEFEHHKLDLSRPRALNIFPDQSFDAINMRALTDSPRFLSMTFGGLERAKAELEAQVTRLLKEDGVKLFMGAAGSYDF